MVNVNRRCAMSFFNNRFLFEFAINCKFLVLYGPIELNDLYYRTTHRQTFNSPHLISSLNEFELVTYYFDQFD